MESQIKDVEILDKKTRSIKVMPMRDFLNPKSTSIESNETGLKPMTFNQAYTMLSDMIQGEVYQNVNYAVRLIGVKHRWDWKI